MSRRRIIYSFLIAPLDPAYKAGLAIAPPVGDSPQLVAGRFNSLANAGISRYIFLRENI
jgi:hypothetical protein